MTFSLLTRLNQLVRLERDAQLTALRHGWERPLAERVALGRAIEGLRLKSLLPDGNLLLECQTNESRFREGDLLVLHHDDPQAPDALQAVLEYDDETEMEMAIIRGNPGFLKASPHGWIADESWLDLSSFFLDALDEVADTRRGRELILPLLGGERLPQLDFARYQRAWEAAYLAGLNEGQCEALAQAYGADLYHLIQGPPGTGKTFVLAHLVRLLVQDGQRVLVTALTHRAINNALNKIKAVDPALPACKIGRAERAGDLLVENFTNFAECGFGELPGGYAVGATPFATRTDRLSHVEFDVVVFDESSQITLPLAIMGMLAGSKYIFIGDERQLPPVVTAYAGELGKQSIFGYLSGRGAETMLEITYRMNDALTAWPSRAFYDNRIRPAAGVGERRLKLAQLAEDWAHVLDPERPAVFLDLLHRNNTVRSRREAEVLSDLVLALLGGGLPAEEIGVVTPYRAQGRLVRNLLREALPDRQMLRSLVVDTVERMQGQEREVVLVSFATSSPTFAASLADFFFQPQRLNVTVTRARTKLILVGSRHLLKAQPETAEQRSWVALLGDLIASCTLITSLGAY